MRTGDISGGPRPTVGVLTFHTAVNYGAALQAYALIRAIRSLGCRAELLDYEPESLRLVHNARLRDSMAPKRLAKYLLSQGKHVRRRQRFESFIRSEIGLSDPIGRPFTTDDLEHHYDSLIVGSDQVWNDDITGDDLAYFLPGSHTAARRISYAASVGKETLTSERAALLRSSLEKFDAVSVREPSAARMIEETTGVRPSVTVDPVFLLDAETWRALAEAPQNNGPYILLYLVSPNSIAEQRARELSRERGVPILAIHKQYWRRIPGATNLLETSPAEFLGIIDRADILVTNSFHGLALSSILGTEAIVTLNPNKGRNQRMEDLARQLASEDSAQVAFGPDQIIVHPRIQLPRVLPNATAESEAFLSRALGIHNGDK